MWVILRRKREIKLAKQEPSPLAEPVHGQDPNKANFPLLPSNLLARPSLAEGGHSANAQADGGK